ncbi:MAG: hypothetical protein IT338_02790 [Thermomicrobiales bacterium]|nr:hypothetical protein [Thermomicrobiales bacterium]
MVAAQNAVRPRKRGKDDGAELNGTPETACDRGVFRKEAAMNGKQIINVASATLLAGGLFAGSMGWTAAQDRPGVSSTDHQHGRGTPATASRSEATDDAMTGMMRDIMAEMMPGMMGPMMDDMMSHMMGGGMQSGSMMGGMMHDGESGRGDHRAMPGMADDQHAQMQAAVAETLGLTPDALEAELADGKSVREIAEAQGVDLADLHEGMMDEFAKDGR